MTGYVVSPEEFEENEDGYTAEIPDTQAHAWVEIYRNGKGWIPLEVTPGYGTGINGDENGDGMEDAIPRPTPAEALPTPEANPVTPAPETPDESEQQDTLMPDLQESEDGEKVSPDQK